MGTKGNKFNLNYFNRMVLSIHVVVLVIIYTVYLNRIFTPSQIPYFNFLTIGFPILFVIAMAFLSYWLLVSWRHFLITFVLSAGLFYPIYLSYPYFQWKDIPQKEATLSVMSFNAHGFRDDGTEALIADHKVDIYLFQEAYESSQKALRADALKGYYAEFHDLLSIYSKYPIIETKQIDFDDSGNGRAAYADIDLGHDTIRVINVYLEPMYIDKDMVKEVIASTTTDEAEISSRKIENKLVKGMKMHEKQLDAILPYIKRSKYPVIIGSDLNATPVSYEYEVVTRLLTDSFIQVGKGNATTFHGFKFPIRIDYLFHSKHLQAIKGQIIRKKHSDHFPVILHYAFTDKLTS